MVDALLLRSYLEKVSVILRGLIKKLYIFFIIKIGLRTAAVMVVFIVSRFLKTSWSRMINGGGTLFYERGMGDVSFECPITNYYKKRNKVLYEFAYK